MIGRNNANATQLCKTNDDYNNRNGDGGHRMKCEWPPPH
jgi:hypothetical protein